MREIRFRGLSVETGGWIFGSLLIINGKYYIHSSDHGDLDDLDFGGWFKEVVKESVGQFIGLPDKNGKEIYEGDIFRSTIHQAHPADAWYSVVYDGRWKGTIVVHDNFCGGMAIDDISKLDWNFQEIIGNIHENNGDNL